MKIFGRDPVMVLSFVSSVILGVFLFVPMDTVWRGVESGLVIAVFGVASAIMVHKADQYLPVFAALGKAVLAFMIVVGVHVTPEAQAGLLMAIELGVGLIVRPQVTAKVGPGEV